MGWTHGKRWTDKAIADALAPMSAQLGRMPTANELRADGGNDLACAISKSYGYLEWARRLGLRQKGSTTHRGQAWERREAGYFRSLGCAVEPQSTKAPFDLLVNGHRMDVKSAKYSEYLRNGQAVRGFVFAGLKRGEDADLFDLVCADGDKLLHRFIIPSASAAVHTVTISPATIAGTGKYSRFNHALHYLHKAA